MPLKIFIDIGSYNGDTLDLALKYDYDIIHCFEPVRQYYIKLIEQVSKMLNGPIVHIHPYGLLDKETTKTIYSPGSDGASIFPEKKQFSHIGQVETCKFRDAETVFREFYNADVLDVKINAEGAEWPIIKRLFESDSINLIDNLCIHYDVLKVPGMEYRMDHMEDILDNYFEHRRLTIGRNKIIYSDYERTELKKGQNWVSGWLNQINNNN